MKSTQNYFDESIPIHRQELNKPFIVLSILWVIIYVFLAYYILFIKTTTQSLYSAGFTWLHLFTLFMIQIIPIGFIQGYLDLNRATRLYSSLLSYYSTGIIFSTMIFIDEFTRYGDMDRYEKITVPVIICFSIFLDFLFIIVMILLNGIFYVLGIGLHKYLSRNN